MNDKYIKTAKWIMLGLIAVSVIAFLFGWIYGFEKNDALAVDVLFIWTYVMVAAAILAIIAIGGYISSKNDASFLKKLGIVLGGAIVLCAVVFLISPGKPAVGMLEQPSAATLRLTDTVLNLTYIFSAAAILSIIVGEVVLKSKNKKAKD